MCLFFFAFFFLIIRWHLLLFLFLLLKVHGDGGGFIFVRRMSAPLVKIRDGVGGRVVEEKVFCGDARRRVRFYSDVFSKGRTRTHVNQNRTFKAYKTSKGAR